MTELLFHSPADDIAPWRERLARLLPGVTLRQWPRDARPEDAAGLGDVRYALVWHPPAGVLARLPNLRGILSLGAGVDHLEADPELPREVPVVRMVDPGMTHRMTEYVTLAVLRHHRRWREYAAQQAETTWRELGVPLAADRRVGIMGLGVLGRDAARMLARLRFDVAGWSSSPKGIDGVEDFVGPEALDAFLARSDILVCMLPLTAETRRIMDAALFAKLPRGASVINVARGDHVVDGDLLAALEAGQVAEATLDVFRDEPLPPEHAFWSHRRILVTPHAASATPPETAAEVVAGSIRTFEAGETPPHVVDWSKGY